MMNLRGKLASQSAIIFGARLAGAGVIFLAQAAIARAWGAAVLGEYLLIIAAVNLTAVVMPLGFQTIATYFAAEYRAKGDRHLLTHFLLRAYGHIGLVALALFVLGYPLTALFGAPGAVIAAHWLPVCLLALGTATVFVNGAVLVGLKRPLAGFFADTLVRPMAVIAAFVVALRLGSPVEAFGEFVRSVAVAYVLIALVHAGFVVHAVRTLDRRVEPSPIAIGRWWRFALPWAIISLATDFFFDIDLLLLAGHLSREELAIFGVCTRVFSLVSFGVAAVYAVTLPDVFESEAQSDRAGFHRKIGEANLVAAGLSLLLFALVLLGGPFALLIFGPSFTAGALPLAVLSLALVVRSVLGPASLVLSVHDRPYASLPAIALGLAMLVTGNWLLVPMFGLMGAACAALVAITVWSGALWLTAWRATGIDVSILPRLRRHAETPAAMQRAG